MGSSGTSVPKRSLLRRRRIGLASGTTSTLTPAARAGEHLESGVDEVALEAPRRLRAGAQLAAAELERIAINEVAIGGEVSATT
jgi:hypothetical protein